MDTVHSTLFVVEDDRDARKGVVALASSMGLSCETFTSAEEFLDRYDPSWAGCLLVDLRLEKMNGLELLKRLATMGSTLPVILIGADVDVPTAVQAMQNGALTVLEKPYLADDLADSIRTAMDSASQTRGTLSRHKDLLRRLDTLTARERRVLELIVAGKPNKAIARDLRISHRTVDRVRADVLEKMGADSAVELAQMVGEVRGGERAEKLAADNLQLRRLLELFERDRQLLAFEIYDGRSLR
jgi:FixJ family two-component response regulator